MIKFTASQYGIPLDPKSYKWDEKTRTFDMGKKNDEDSVVLDFGQADGITFLNLYSNCTVKAGDHCTIKAQSFAHLVVGSYCSIHVKNWCNISAEADCNLKTGDCCVILAESIKQAKVGKNCVFIDIENHNIKEL